MKYQWILFDADETLFHFDAFRGLQLMFSRHNIVFSNSDFEQYEAINKPLWVDYQNGIISATELQNIRFETWAAALSLSTEQLNTAFLKAMADICTPLAGAKSMLEALSQHAKLGIITNGFTALQEIRLERTGFADFFDVLIISEQVGVAKPDVKIYDYACQQMNITQRQQVLMVGDNPHSDILGGINAGMDTCWLNSDQKPLPKGITPTYTIASLAELQTILLT
ncbi:dUMP phosphatase [Photobacterium kishitanii]|uniref:dUMP phosphatase n=1 Tax=Photobacterium kishitanii TaxID=318456 RepID=A0AAX0YW36_9GAMM|nr:pyrimidine 5'-nucleotidase [Photobacterium kishitanii]KJG57904.1 dUMP phosphatase [Photobacterium kishitanii]KJG61479.1 dUMP phosphatase [Photobacterium kishitanii]KJG66293.1 dUMP phosphatase [Photobacterium kishitanii]KJG69625.1 dUMP phosphatase [Photobacterium kishitanii]PSX19872.1 dUMP phosphatase [Photobacterium kishitanii]